MVVTRVYPNLGVRYPQADLALILQLIGEVDGLTPAALSKAYATPITQAYHIW